MKNKFWKIYKIVVLILVLIIITVLTILYLCLDSYEKSIPTMQAEKIIKLINKKDTKNIANYIKLTNDELNPKDIIKDSIILEDGNYFYTKNTSKYKDDSPVYNIYKDSKIAATLYLKKDNKKNLFNFARYEIDYVDGFLGDKSDITVIAPDEAKVYVNGVLVDKKYVTDEDYVSDNMAFVTPFVKIDKFNKYVINDLYSTNVEISYKNNKKEIKDENNIFTYTYDEDSKILNSVSDDIEKFIRNYTLYVVNEGTFDSIKSYLIPSSKLYSDLSLIQTTNKWMSKHTATKFSDINISNMQAYNDEAFIVDVTYKYSFHVISVNKDVDFDTLIKLHLIKKDGKWYVVGLNT